MGTVCVLEAARTAGVRKLVYAASSSCYGIATEVPTAEKAPIAPQYPYALSKYLGEEAVLANGWLPVSLGPRVLRAETAALTALAALLS